VIEGVAQRTIPGAGVELALAEAGDPRRATVVLIHGYPDTKELWSGVMARLATDLHVVAYDVRGAGASSTPPTARAYGLDLLGADFQAVAQAVAPGRRVHVVGHDWGGIQAWELATNARYAEQVASMTTIAGPSLDQVTASGASLLRHGRLREALRRARRSWYIALYCLPGGPWLMWRVWMAPERWGKLVGGPDPGEYPTSALIRTALNGAHLYRRNIPPRLLRPRPPAVARVPVLLIVPSHDRFIPPSYYDLAERYAPGLRREVLDGAHWLPRTHPDQVAGLIRDHVQRARAGSGRADT
jgi:pimeloyl-ACP methyl ester carboxylesterase